MNQKLKEKWVKALTSGEYQQGGGQLERHGAYCCLGVLGVVAGIPFDPTNGLLYRNAGDERLAFLNAQKQFALARMNDDGIPFDVIAGFINENL